MIDREHSLAPSFALGGATLYRRRAWVFSWLSASFLLVAAASAQTAGEEQGYRKGTETLILQTRQGARHKLVVELAATPAEQSRGLMFRTRLRKARYAFSTRPAAEGCHVDEKHLPAIGHALP